MEIEKSVENKWLVMRVSGQIDALTAPKLEAETKTIMDQGNVWISMNLSSVHYISSAGLRILLTTLKAANGKNGNLVLISPAANVREVLDIAGFSKIFTIADRLDDLSD
jgi:anti-anti-sigma factor